MQPIPWGSSLVALKGIAGAGALLDDLSVSTLDPNPVRRKNPSIVGITVQPLEHGPRL
jgi:hypothetical protein